MLPPADFRLVKIVQKLSHQNRKSFLDPSHGEAISTTRRHWAKFLSLKEHNVLFDYLLWTFLLMIVVGEISHLQGSFQGAIGLDNCVRYKCNRPRLYFTEEHSIRWKFCLVNQKLFHLIWSASENQSVRTHRSRRNPIFEDQRKLTTYRSVQKCTEESISQ